MISLARIAATRVFTAPPKESPPAEQLAREYRQRTFVDDDDLIGPVFILDAEEIEATFLAGYEAALNRFT